MNLNWQVEESGMEVLKKEEKTLSKDEAAEFYKQHEGSEHFDQLVEFMTRYCEHKSSVQIFFKFNSSSQRFKMKLIFFFP